MTDLFSFSSGAKFSDCRKYRYMLWRIWDQDKPYVMFVGLNPSKASEYENDPTIKRVMAIANHNGYGGVFMLNLFAWVSRDPDALLSDYQEKVGFQNNNFLKEASDVCDKVVFAWGNFKVAEQRAKDVMDMFPNAYALHINKNGTPKHPLYCKADTPLIRFQK